MANPEPWNGYNGHKGSVLRRRFLVPPSATSSCMYLLLFKLDLRKYNIEMIMNQSMLTRRHFFILASDNQNDVEMQNKINDRNRAREERHKQHIARNEGNYKVIFRIAK